VVVELDCCNGCWLVFLLSLSSFCKVISGKLLLNIWLTIDVYDFIASSLLRFPYDRMMIEASNVCISGMSIYIICI